MWIGLQELEATVRSFDSRRGVDRAFVRTMPIKALLASVIRRETHRLQLARDAAAGVIPGEDEIPPQVPVADEQPAESSIVGGD